MPDTANQAVNAANEKSVNLRLTWQVSPKHKLNFFYDQHWRCQCAITSPIISQEAANEIHYPISDLRSIAYTATPTNRVLIEARFGVRREEYAYTPTSTIDPQRLLIPVIEQGGSIPGLLYRGGGISTATQPYQRTLGVSIPFAASLAYVTGSHSFKSGFYNVTANRDSHVDDNVAHLTYQFLNGVPNQLTQRATPLDRSERQHLDLGIYAQDKWTVNRLTLSYGVRFDHFSSYFPAQTLGPAPLVPTRNLSFPETADGELVRHRPARRLGVRSVRQRDDRAQGVDQQVHVVAGAAGDLRRHRQSRQPAREHRDAKLDRPERELRPRLRSDEPAGAGQPRTRRRLLRRGHRHQLRQLDAQPPVRPGRC